MAVVIILLVLIALVAGAIAGVIWVRDTIRTQDEDKAAAQTQTVYPDPQPCDPQALTVEATGPESLSPGQGAAFSLVITNTADLSCLLDAGASSLGVVITSGDHQVWDSTVCPVGASERRLLLAKGSAAEVSLEWNGYVATSDCAVATAPAPSQATTSDPQASASPGPTATPALAGEVAGAGTYRYRFTLGGADLSQDTVFAIH